MSDNKSLNFWCNALLGATALTIVLSLGLILPPYPAIAYFNFLFFEQTNYPILMTEMGQTFATFQSGLMGSITLGWMVPMIYLVHRPLRQGDATARRVIALSMSIWFVSDGLVSIALGFWQNAISNLSLAILFAVPLYMVGRHTR